MIKLTTLLKEAKTPWGTSDAEYPLERGVVWYGTPSHGGLGVSTGVAKKKLSPQARALGELWGSTYWFEEDIAWTIPMYENPDWMKKLVKTAGGKIQSKSQLEKSIKRWFPKYFDKAFGSTAKANLSIPKIEVGDYITLRGSGTYQVVGIKGQTFIVAGDDYKNYKLGKNRVNKDATKITKKSGQVVWEKK